MWIELNTRVSKLDLMWRHITIYIETGRKTDLL
jgi:hypothetical protein